MTFDLTASSQASATTASRRVGPAAALIPAGSIAAAAVIGVSVVAGDRAEVHGQPLLGGEFAEHGCPFGDFDMVDQPFHGEGVLGEPAPVPSANGPLDITAPAVS